MSETSRRGGLVGLFDRLATLVGRISFKAETIALFLVLAAGVLTILKKNGVNIPEYALYFGVSLGIAALLYEMHSAKGMAKAWYYAKPGALVASTLIWACAFGYSVNAWVGAASESQAEKTNVHKAAFNASQDVSKAEKASEKAYQDAVAVRDRITGMPGKDQTAVKPWRTAADAKALVDSAKAKWQWEASAGCTQAAKNTRKACDEYRSAKADLDRWDELAKANIAVGEREAAWNEARKAKTGTAVSTSEDRDDLIILTKYAGMTEQGAQLFNGLFSIIAISIFLSFGSMRAELERLSAQGPRRRFNFWLALRGFYWRWVHGKEPPGVTIHNTTINQGDGFGTGLRHELAARGAI